MQREDLEYGWFSPPDFEVLLGVIHRHPTPREFVVVGGQSVVAWALAYGIDIPGPASETPLTADFDFQLPLEEARWLARELGAEFHAAAVDDPTVNAATLVLLNHDGTKKLMIDVLKYVHGLQPGLKISDWANEVQFGAYPPIWVLNPLYVLRSRFANLHGLPSKRNRNSLAQARVAIEVARRYVMRQPSGEAVREVRELGRLAADVEGVYCFHEYGLDPLVGLEEWFCADPYARQFHWPTIMREVERKRAVDAARRARIAAKR